MFPPSLENVINSFQPGSFNFISFLGVKMFFVLWLSVWFSAGMGGNLCGCQLQGQLGFLLAPGTQPELPLK